MRLFSIIDRTFSSYGRYLIRNGQRLRFISELSAPKSELSYLNLISHTDKTHFLSKDDLKRDFDPKDYSPLSRYIENYKRKVSSLSSRIKEIESFYQSESDQPQQLEYETVGSHAYYLRNYKDSTWLFRSNLPFKESEIVEYILARGIPIINFSEFENQGISNLKKIRISLEGDIMALLYDAELNDRCKVAFYSVSEERVLNFKLEDVSEIQFMPYHKSKNFMRVYYTKMNEGKRSYKFIKFLINKKTGFRSKERLVYEEPEHFISLLKSKSGEAVFMATTSYNKVFSTFMIDARGKMYVIPNYKNGKLFLEQRRESVYVIYPNTVSEIVKIPVYKLRTHRSMIRSRKKSDNTMINYMEGLNQKPKENENKETIKLDYMVTDIDMFEKGLVMYLQKGPSSPCLGILSFGNNKNKDNKQQEGEEKGNLVFIELPLKVGVLEPGSNLNYRSERVKMSVSSAGEALVNLEADLNQKKIKEVGEVEVEKDIKSFILQVPSSDGSCKIPVTIVVKDKEINKVTEIRRRKCVVYVYGFYGESLRVCNYPEHKALLEMGYVLCFAHVRGGGELGEEWQKMGSKGNKHNSFYDLVEVMKCLIGRNVTSREMMALSVSSAAGILGGCVYNMRPDLCSVIVLKMPYLDLFRTLKEDKEPLVEMEYEEFGNTSFNFKEKEVMDQIYSMDPCNNVKSNCGRKPVLIINTDKKDIRTPWYQTAKFISLLKEEEQKERVFVKMSSHGHEGSPPHQEAIKTVSEEVSIVDYYLNQSKNKIEKYDHVKR